MKIAQCKYSYTIFISNKKSQIPESKSVRSSYQSNSLKEQNRATRIQDKRIDKIYEDSRRICSEQRSKKPKFEELGVLRRNNEWLANRDYKLDAERRWKKEHEIDGWTFEPKINKSRQSYDKSRCSSRSNASIGWKTNRSYSDIHGRRDSSSMNNSYRSLNNNYKNTKHLIKTNFESSWNTISFKPESKNSAIKPSSVK